MSNKSYEIVKFIKTNVLTKFPKNVCKVMVAEKYTTNTHYLVRVYPNRLVNVNFKKHFVNLQDIQPEELQKIIDDFIIQVIEFNNLWNTFTTAVDELKRKGDE